MGKGRERVEGGWAGKEREWEVRGDNKDHD